MGSFTAGTHGLAVGSSGAGTSAASVVGGSVLVCSDLVAVGGADLVPASSLTGVGMVISDGAVAGAVAVVVRAVEALLSSSSMPIKQ